MKNYRILACLLLLAGLLTGCLSSGVKPELARLFPTPTEQNVKKIEIRHLDVEPYSLDTIESSYMGYLELRNDTIYLIDKRYCWVFRFTKEGRLIDRQMGLGAGPKEYDCGSIDGYCHLQDGRWIFLDPGAGYT